MKFLYYTPVSWPHLTARCDSFPHSNRYFDAPRGIALYSDTITGFRAAEAAGFDWLGIGEEHMNAYGMVPNPCLMAAALATVTTRAQLCILGNPLPLLNPLRVAEEYAMVDMLSGGRMVAGFPRGVPQNYEAYGVDMSGSRDRLAEAIAFVTAAWQRRGPFDWNGTHYQYRNVSIWPQPTTLPEIVLSAKSPESRSLAVQYRAVMAEVYVKSKQVLEHFLVQVGDYRRESQAAGWQAHDDRFLLSVPCVIAPTSRQACTRAQLAADYVSGRISGYYEEKKTALKDSYYGAGHVVGSAHESIQQRVEYGGLICGDPSAVSDQIEALRNATGVGMLGLQMQWGNLPANHVLESIELFGAKVRPHYL